MMQVTRIVNLTGWIGDEISLTKEQLDEFEKDPYEWAANYYEINVEDFREWESNILCVRDLRCDAINVDGKRCRNFAEPYSRETMNPQDWVKSGRTCYCHCHSMRREIGHQK